MTHSDGPDLRDPSKPFGIDPEPTVLGRVARWTERARILRARTEAARTRHASVDFGLTLIERDSGMGGGLLAGALAYRLFVLALPTALLLVSGLGVYADTADQSTTQVTRKAGLHGLIGSQVAATASGRARVLVFILMVPAVLYATVKLYRALAIVHAIAWQGSGRGAGLTRRGVGALGAALATTIVAAEVAGWARRQDHWGGLVALLVYILVIGFAWLMVSMQLPHREARWPWLLPGALLVGVGALFVNFFNVYVTTRLVEDRANTYGALGVATALLLSLVLVGRMMVVSAELNATIDERHNLKRPAP